MVWVKKPYQAYIVAEPVLETPCGLHNVCVSGLFAWYPVGPDQQLSDLEPICQWIIPQGPQYISLFLFV